MNGGSLTSATNEPLRTPKAVVTSKPGEDCHQRRDAKLDGEACHDHRTQRHDHTVGKIDACGQDHQGLPHGEGAYDHHLLDDQGEVLTREELVCLKTEEYDGDQQSQCRTNRWR